MTTSLNKPVARAVLQATEPCAHCPNLCLHACPAATAEATTTVAPWAKMLLARWFATGEAKVTPDAAATLQHCMNCGACTDACVHEVPVGPTLQSVVIALGEAGVLPVAPTPVPLESDASQPLPPGVSGAALLAAGHVAAFTRAAKASASRWSRCTELVFESLGDLACVADDFPRFGVTVTATLRAKASDPGPIEGPAAWFEPCQAARSPHLDRHALRQAVEAWAGPLVSLRWEGKTATCCGAGGSYAAAAPEGARQAARRILQSALDHGARTLLVPCSGCAEHLARSSGGLPLVVRRA